MLLLLSYNTVAGHWVTGRNRHAPRDPETGILRGAEPRTLGPDDAPVAVLLVHGYLGGSNNFADLPDRLAACGWRVRVMRLPGHGTSPEDLERVTVDDFVHSVEVEYDALRARYKKVVLVGHSMGGALCTIMASRHEVDGLVLAAPYFGVTYRWFYILRPETWAEISRPLVRWVYKGRHFVRVNRKEVRDEIISYAWVPTQSVRTLLKLAEEANRPDVLENISCPVLWLHAPGDRAASFTAAAKAVEAMPAAQKRTVTLERSDHILFWDYDREQVATEIEQFIRSLL